ncbi:hypothetical protein C9374_008514 [Naegleria lovaniensis]|uniref:Uncharacterized protein n=1 Tax=Naegleria lovaniensis TaxID=51637 RepID=A0AA88KHN8_NAELO|nr:uncharacterized protein C9374_008514 [Naegleria lovaniensis]KAG2378371.1 hypothetical protein C9374_008514 [Naegleria lovaniensis]
MVSLIENKFLGASKSLFNVRSLLESNGLTSPVHNGKHPLSTYVRNDEQVRVQLRPLLCLMKFAYGACLIRPNSLELEPVIRRHEHTVIKFLLNHEGLRRFSNVLEWSVDNDDEKEPLIICELIKIQYSGNNEFQMFLIDENIKIYGVDEWKMVIERLYYLKERK